MKIDIREKGRLTLFGIEVLMTTCGINMWLMKKFHWDMFNFIVGAVVTAGVLVFLFFNVRLFRYLYVIIASLFWALLIYMFTMGKNGLPAEHPITRWVAIIIVFVISIAVHKDYFYFEKS